MKLSLYTLAISTLATICLVVTPVGAEVRLAERDYATMRSCSATRPSICGARPRRRKRSPSISTTSRSQPPRAIWACGRPGSCRSRPAVLSPSLSAAAPNLAGLTCWWAMYGLPPASRTWRCHLPDFLPAAHITNAAQEIAQADLPQVRLLLHGAQILRFSFGRASPPAWQPCTPATAKDFSAVAYFFAREINRREHIPIGVIDSSWGGTPIDSWISLDSLSADASLMPAFAARAHFADMQTHMELIESAEKHADAEAAAQHLPAPSHPWHPDPSSWIPAALYNGMVAPFTPYTIKGFLWYQGETDSAPDRVRPVRETATHAHRRLATAVGPRQPTVSVCPDL